MTHINAETTVGEIIRDPRFFAFGKRLGFSTGMQARKKSIADFTKGQSPWRHAEMVYGLNAAFSHIDKGIEVCRDIYTEVQMEEVPSRKNTALYYFPTIMPDAPFVLICPGGAYFSVAVTVEGFPVAAKLNEMGINAFVLNYRTKLNCFQNALEDMHTALRYIIDKADGLGISTEGYAVMGFSAGGHLASMMGTDTYGCICADLPKPSALILGYPVVEFNTSFVLKLCKIGAFGLFPSKKILEKASAVENFTANSPAIYIWHTLDDKSVPYETNGKALHERAMELGIPVEHLAVHSGPHGMGLAADSQAEGWLDGAVVFWVNQRKF